jgi:hypothetical protein
LDAKTTRQGVNIASVFTDLAEFRSILAFKSVELSNGGTLTAPSSNFDDVFHQEIVDGEDRQVRFTTEGRVVNEQLKSTV